MKVFGLRRKEFQKPGASLRALDQLHQEKPITELMQGGATGAINSQWNGQRPSRRLSGTSAMLIGKPTGARQDRSETRRC